MLQKILTLVCRASDLRNNYFAKVGQRSEVFAERLFAECANMHRRVVIEELQLDEPRTVGFGELPPNAALLISFIDAEDVVTLLCEEAKKAGLQLSDEPSAKRASKHADSLRLHHIASCLRDQCYVPVAPDEADTDEVPTVEDMSREMSAQQMSEKIVELLSPQAWTDRMAGVWAKNILFQQLPLKPAMKTVPLAWATDEQDGFVVAGICSADATQLRQVVRPCFANFAGENYPTPQQLQKLCSWHEQMLAELLPVLMDRKISYVDSVRMLQGELHTALATAPHQGVGIESLHRGAFSTIEMNRQHACKCQRCLGIFAGLQRISREHGLFAVLQQLFDLMGVGKVYSFCAFLTMLLMQTVVGSAAEIAVVAPFVMVGRQASGKTFTLDAIFKAMPSFMCETEKSSSEFGQLFGDFIAGFGTNCMIKSARTLSINNEMRLFEGPGSLTKDGDGYIGRNSGLPPSDKGQRQKVVDTTVVWTARSALGATNDMAVRDGKGSMKHNAAMLSRWEQIHGMKVPADVQRCWADPKLELVADCSQKICQHILSMLDLQTFGLTAITDRLVPSIAVLIAAFDALVLPTDLAGQISVRTTNRMRAVVVAAWRAEMTSMLMLSGRPIGIKDILIGHASPVPYEFAIFMLQASSSSECVAEHIESFGVLGLQATLHEDPTKMTQRAALLREIPIGDANVVHKKLKKVATGITVSPEFSAQSMELQLVPLTDQQIYGVPIFLIAMHPPQTTIDAARKILLLLLAMARNGRLMVDADYVYLPHCLVMWLNGQNVQLIDRLRDNQPVTTGDSLTRTVHASDKLSADDATVLGELSNDLKTLDELRRPGVVWALIHCGADCPTLTGTDYELTKALQKFVHEQTDDAKADRVVEASIFTAARSNRRGDESAPRHVSLRMAPAEDAEPIKKLPTDYVHGAEALTRMDISPDRYKPFRFLMRTMETPPVGVSPSIRKVEAEMPLPDNMEIELMNNGVVVVSPRTNRLKYGDTMTATPFPTFLDVCVHPNDQLGDILTCFAVSENTAKLSTNSLYYMHTLYNLLYTAPYLLEDIADEDIYINTRHVRPPSVDWTLDAAKERGWLGSDTVTTTVRMVVLAYIVDGIGASEQIRVPATFVKRLTDTTFTGSETDLVPSIVRFITKRMKITRLLMCARHIVEKLVKRKDTADEYFGSLLDAYSDKIKKDVGVSITKWYRRLSKKLDHVYTPDAFISYNETFDLRFKE